MEWRGSAGPVFTGSIQNWCFACACRVTSPLNSQQKHLEQPRSSRFGPLLPVPRSVSVLDDHPVGWVWPVKLV